MSLIEPHRETGDVDEGEEVGGGFLVASGNSTEAFEAMKEAFDHVSKRIQALVGATSNLARWMRWNDGLQASRFRGFADFGRVVAGVSDAGFALRVRKKVECFSHFVSLTCGQRDVERLAFGRCDRVDFGRKTSSRTAQSIASDPPFPPAASWCARMTVPSRSEPMSSDSSWSSLNKRSHRPRAAQRAKRLYTVFQGPYRSGISRHGAPVFTRQTTALMKSRSERFVGGPGRSGISGCNFFH